MNIFFKITGFLYACIGVFALLPTGELTNHFMIVGFSFLFVGIAMILIGQMLTRVNKKHARKELMELKALLDNGILTSEEYDEKSKVLKSKI